MVYIWSLHRPFIASSLQHPRPNYFRLPLTFPHHLFTIPSLSLCHPFVIPSLCLPRPFAVPSLSLCYPFAVPLLSGPEIKEKNPSRQHHLIMFSLTRLLNQSSRLQLLLLDPIIESIEVKKRAAQINKISQEIKRAGSFQGEKSAVTQSSEMEEVSSLK